MNDVDGVAREYPSQPALRPAPFRIVVWLGWIVALWCLAGLALHVAHDWQEATPQGGILVGIAVAAMIGAFRWPRTVTPLAVALLPISFTPAWEHLFPGRGVLDPFHALAGPIVLGLVRLVSGPRGRKPDERIARLDAVDHALLAWGAWVWVNAVPAIRTAWQMDPPRLWQHRLDEWLFRTPATPIEWTTTLLTVKGWTIAILVILLARRVAVISPRMSRRLASGTLLAAAMGAGWLLCGIYWPISRTSLAGHMGPWPDIHAAGAWTVCATVLAWAWVSNARPAGKAALIVVGIVGLAATVASGSRASQLALTAIACCSAARWLWRLRRSWSSAESGGRRQLPGVLVVVAIALVGAGALFASPVARSARQRWMRWAEVARKSIDGKESPAKLLSRLTSRRTERLGPAYRMWREAPLTGLGTGAFARNASLPRYDSPFLTHNQHVHCWPAEMTVNHGLGFCLLVAAVLVGLRRGERERQTTGPPLVSACRWTLGTVLLVNLPAHALLLEPMLWTAGIWLALAVRPPNLCGTGRIVRVLCWGGVAVGAGLGWLMWPPPAAELHPVFKRPGPAESLPDGTRYVWLPARGSSNFKAVRGYFLFEVRPYRTVSPERPIELRVYWDGELLMRRRMIAERDTWRFVPIDLTRWRGRAGALEYQVDPPLLPWPNPRMLGVAARNFSHADRIPLRFTRWYGVERADDGESVRWSSWRAPLGVQVAEKDGEVIRHVRLTWRPGRPLDDPIRIRIEDPTGAVLYEETVRDQPWRWRELVLTDLPPGVKTIFLNTIPAFCPLPGTRILGVQRRIPPRRGSRAAARSSTSINVVAP